MRFLEAAAKITPTKTLKRLFVVAQWHTEFIVNVGCVF